MAGLPFTGAWRNSRGKTTELGYESNHCDKNAVGATVIVSLYDVPGGKLNIQRPNGNWSSHKLEPGVALAGRWGEFSHFTSEVDDATFLRRVTYVFYLDRYSFQTTFRSHVPKGFKK